MYQTKVLINTQGNWKLYTPWLPTGSEVIGTAYYGQLHGALIRHGKQRKYYIVQDSEKYPVDGRLITRKLKEEVAKRPVGRPRQTPLGNRSNIYIDDALKETAKRLGDGNISAGIALALLAYEEEKII